MRADEMRDTGVLAGTTFDEITTTARDMHRAIAARLFGLAGRPGAAVKLAHDGIAALAYGGTRLGVKHLPPMVGLAAGAFQDPTAPSIHDVPKGRFTFGAVSGVVGDRMAEEGGAVAPQMRLRLGRGPLRRLPANLVADAAADGAVTGRLVVFAHGLCETDLCWSYAAEKRWGDRTATYGSKLAEDDGWTPLYLNFNTGLHISANGAEIADLLEEVVRDWPVRVTEIALVGHSLGGLVARSAVHRADERDQAVGSLAAARRRARHAAPRRTARTARRPRHPPARPAAGDGSAGSAHQPAQRGYQGPAVRLGGGGRLAGARPGRPGRPRHPGHADPGGRLLDGLGHPGAHAVRAAGHRPARAARQRPRHRPGPLDPVRAGSHPPHRRRQAPLRPAGRRHRLREGAQLAGGRGRGRLVRRRRSLRRAGRAAGPGLEDAAAAPERSGLPGAGPASFLARAGRHPQQP